ncbi:hypothetical protein BH160DRAFT_5188 [Burkholderia sp. H160]|nr:hypothetical protein BH160DRAFT_5188 [Burkholderia sp. H160]
MRQRRVETAFAGQTTRAVPEAFSKRLFQQCKGARPKSSLLQGASQAMGMDTMPNRCVKDAELGATLSQSFAFENCDHLILWDQCQNAGFY